MKGIKAELEIYKKNEDIDFALAEGLINQIASLVMASGAHVRVSMQPNDVDENTIIQKESWLKRLGRFMFEFLKNTP